ncbi:hypothetical protein LCGC14_1969340 [marine sediment metagenome]|uniref:Uncharacterized protein n=1 Tax=marine sediment metagenome TaxID=412755 RepID=A0A0F9FC85_9ZZZZ
MTYAVEADVQERMARIAISDVSKVTSSQVTDIEAQIAAEIDSLLDYKGVSVPVTSPDWFVTRLQGLSADGTTSIVLKSFFPEAVGPGESPAYAFYESRYRRGLKMLEEYGAGESPTGPQSEFHTEGTPTDPLFPRDKVY